METIESLVKAGSEADKAVTAAEQSRNRIFNTLHGPLKTRFELYYEAFDQLRLRAEDLKHKITEIHEDGFYDGGVHWGNGGLSRVPVEENGFTYIYTADYFRGEGQTIMSRIPSKYLLNDGEQRIREDTARIESELDALQKLQDAEKERAQRDEYERLKARFG